jgi:hypothetical protein
MKQSKTIELSNLEVKAEIKDSGEATLYFSKGSVEAEEAKLLLNWLKDEVLKSGAITNSFDIHSHRTPERSKEQEERLRSIPPLEERTFKREKFTPITKPPEDVEDLQVSDLGEPPVKLKVNVRQ